VVEELKLDIVMITEAKSKYTQTSTTSQQMADMKLILTLNRKNMNHGKYTQRQGIDYLDYVRATRDML